MNINDVKNVPAITEPSSIASGILSRQNKLEDFYWTLEKRHKRVFDLNERPGQIIIKDFLWRITEELGEALEADTKEHNLVKIHEELADCLHFIAGLGIISDISDEFINGFMEFSYEIVPQTNPRPIPQLAPTAVSMFVQALGVMGNTLKMKPWKQTDVMTDVNYAKFCYRQLVKRFLEVCHAFGLTLPILWDLYYRKSEVNLFRIESGY